jgi:hypothetical protein
MKAVRAGRDLNGGGQPGLLFRHDGWQDRKPASQPAPASLKREILHYAFSTLFKMA